MPKKRPHKFIVSVRDLGAAGDGITDDSDAFVKAGQSRAKRIKVPPGVYRIARGVHLDARFISTTKGR